MGWSASDEGTEKRRQQAGGKARSWSRQRRSGYARRRTMSHSTFTPGPTPKTVRATDGTVLTAPDGWALLPPGDAALTGRVKAAGDHWVVQETKGRKVFSRGVW